MIDGTFFINLGSITYAYKAQRMLVEAGIKASIGKSTSKSGRMGCSYGINVQSSNRDTVFRMLAQNSIKYYV